MSGTRKVNVITGQPEVRVADVIRYLERQRGYKMTVAEVGRRWLELQSVADECNRANGLRE